MPELDPRRRLPLEGARNFRDLGGYPAGPGAVAWRRVYRADRLTDLSAADVAELVEQRGLRTVVDLRTSAEVARHGPGLLAGYTQRLHLSLLNPALGLRPSLDYADWVEAAQAELAAVFALMTGEADPFPLVFHCSVGKDRTGILAALLLAALDAPRAVIVEDYALTRQFFRPSDEQTGRWRQRVLRHFPSISGDTARRLLDASPRSMEQLLDALEQRHGSVQGYLASLGVGEVQRQVLRARLCENARPVR